MHHVDILHAIGKTPLVELRHLSPRPDVRLFAKLEGRNPTGSVKDRIVREMVFAAEHDGRLRHGGRIIEASTGNTGIALAMVGRALGYHVRIVIPENVFPDEEGRVVVKIDEPGSYPFKCDFHPQQTGTLILR